ncbi:MAG: hypothetical protein WCY89_10415 [Flavobacteriaceae bacterium]
MKSKILNSIYVVLFLTGIIAQAQTQANGVPNPLNNPTNNPIMPPPPSPANPPGDDEASIDFGLLYLLMAGATTGIYLLSKKYKKQEG